MRSIKRYVCMAVLPPGTNPSYVLLMISPLRSWSFISGVSYAFMIASTVLVKRGLMANMRIVSGVLGASMSLIRGTTLVE